MAIILNLETATTNCSVSISIGNKIIAIKEHNSPKYSHSEQLHIFIQDLFKQASLHLNDVDAIAVSKGPGSYTGLRIGVSAAKGLCFALDVPLISVSTLKSLTLQALPTTNDFVIPLLDARRMEVYAAVFDPKLKEVRETRAEVINENSFSDFARQGTALLVGSGAKKCQSVLRGSNFRYALDAVPSAKEMAQLAYEKFKKNDFEDLAYFEPYYLKDFMVTTKKK